MIFKNSGDIRFPTIILLHGGGLSYWSLDAVVEILSKDYYVVTPIICGHSENAEETFISIADSAKILLEYIDAKCGGKVFAICGLSLGAQIAVEVLALKPSVAEYAVLESPLVIPLKIISRFITPIYNIAYHLIKNKQFAKIQSKSLLIPKDQFEKYYADSIKMSKQTLINIALSNANFNLKDNIAKTKAKVLIIVGGAEIKIIQKSSRMIHGKIPGSALYVAEGMKHGELSLKHPTEYVEIIKSFFKK